MLRRDPELQLAFLCKVTHELREAQRRAMAIGRRDAAGRLAMFLIMLRDHLGGRDADPNCVPLVMSRSDIADFLALSLEAMSRASADLSGADSSSSRAATSCGSSIRAGSRSSRRPFNRHFRASV